MKSGDKVRVTWNDGLVKVGTYVRRERGYEVFLDEDKEQFVCLPNHVKSIEVINEGR
jgi:predicted nucleic acid-binding Zn finger protein